MRHILRHSRDKGTIYTSEEFLRKYDEINRLEEKIIKYNLHLSKVLIRPMRHSAEGIKIIYKVDNQTEYLIQDNINS